MRDGFEQGAGPAQHGGDQAVEEGDPRDVEADVRALQGSRDLGDGPDGEDVVPRRVAFDGRRGEGEQDGNVCARGEGPADVERVGPGPDAFPQDSGAEFLLDVGFGPERDGEVGDEEARVGKGQGVPGEGEGSVGQQGGVGLGSRDLGRDGAGVARVDLDVGRVVVVEDEAGAVDAEVGGRQGGVELGCYELAEELDRCVGLGALEEADDGVEDVREADGAAALEGVEGYLC